MTNKDMDKLHDRLRTSSHIMATGCLIAAIGLSVIIVLSLIVTAIIVAA